MFKKSNKYKKSKRTIKVHNSLTLSFIFILSMITNRYFLNFYLYIGIYFVFHTVEVPREQEFQLPCSPLYPINMSVFHQALLLADVKIKFLQERICRLRFWSRVFHFLLLFSPSTEGWLWLPAVADPWNASCHFSSSTIFITYFEY